MSKLPNIKKLLSKVAPVIGSALGSPLANLAINAIAGVLGIDQNKNQKDIESEIESRLASATMDDLLAIKNADIEFEQFLAKIDLDRYSISVEDVKDARSKTFGNWLTSTIAIIVVTATLFVAGYVVINGVAVDVQSATIVGMIIGTLVGGFSQVLNYLFGSSDGSKSKTEYMANIIKSEKS